MEALQERGISLEHVATVVGQPEADPFDLICPVAEPRPVGSKRRMRKIEDGQVAKSAFQQSIDQTRSPAADIHDRSIAGRPAKFDQLERGRRALLKPGDFILGLAAVDILPVGLSARIVHLRGSRA